MNPPKPAGSQPDLASLLSSKCKESGQPGGAAPPKGSRLALKSSKKQLKEEQKQEGSQTSGVEENLRTKAHTDHDGQGKSDPLGSLRLLKDRDAETFFASRASSHLPLVINWATHSPFVLAKLVRNQTNPYV